MGGRTDRPSYRVARTHVKSLLGIPLRPSPHLTLSMKKMINNGKGQSWAFVHDTFATMTRPTTTKSLTKTSARTKLATMTPTITSTTMLTTTSVAMKTIIDEYDFGDHKTINNDKNDNSNNNEDENDIGYDENNRG